MAYTYNDLISASFDSKIYPSISSQVDLVGAANFAARNLLKDLDLKATKRMTALPSNLFDDEFDYQAPSDLKDNSLCDIVAQFGRRRDDQWHMYVPSDFDRYKGGKPNICAVDILGNVPRIRATIPQSALNYLVIANFDSTTSDGVDGGGTGWQAFGNASNVRTDNVDFVKGNGSVKFDYTGSATTAGIFNDGVGAFDWSSYFSNAQSMFLRVRGGGTITNWQSVKVRLGSSASNYDEFTATASVVSTPFQQGWQIVRFDFSSVSTVGTPVRTAGNYVALIITFSSAPAASTNWGFDYLIAQNGRYHNFAYYSKCAWQDSSGNYIENTTTTTDTVVADTSDDFNLFVKALRVEVDRRLKDYIAYELDVSDYNTDVAKYKQDHPSEAMLLEQPYYDVENFGEWDNDLNSRQSRGDNRW